METWQSRSCREGWAVLFARSGQTNNPSAPASQKCSFPPLPENKAICLSERTCRHPDRAFTSLHINPVSLYYFRFYSRKYLRLSIALLFTFTVKEKPVSAGATSVCVCCEVKWKSIFSAQWSWHTPAVHGAEVAAVAKHVTIRNVEKVCVCGWLH